ncbi:hypothetical protein TRFO_21149 [Tritrichomonas foetus]|uniref:Protein kinase domain-containing protein n=1 Tax=Tritrichomonas foetus TaxID=1144522 RepID=A0A1J4KIZ2_9EUKA|nr:hypothetical protein TRFO_21149 [Tritrichomonas foetus]|eukprot:OHT09796.1 hypothetical protein TRFO_21149 [Tritrichomonas foetus]
MNTKFSHFLSYLFVIFHRLLMTDHPFTLPFTIRNYVLTEEIGKGGFGCVFKARSSNYKVDFDFAIKMMRTPLGTTQFGVKNNNSMNEDQSNDNPYIDPKIASMKKNENNESILIQNLPENEKSEKQPNQTAQNIYNQVDSNHQNKPNENEIIENPSESSNQKTINKPINRPINNPINNPINRPISNPINKKINNPIKKPYNFMSDSFERDIMGLDLKNMKKKENPEDIMRRHAASMELEAIALQSLDHPNVIRLYDYFSEGGYTFLVLEYCAHGTLDDRLNHLTFSDLVKITLEIIAGLQYCHENNLAHQDIKAANILFDSNDRVKIADFGLSQILTNSNELTNNGGGSLLYVAPEVINKVEHSPFKADIWSLGVLIYLMFSKHFPFNGNDRSEAIRKIRNGIYTMTNVPSDIGPIIKKMLRVEPNQRIQLIEVQNYFTKLAAQRNIKITNITNSSSIPSQSHGCQLSSRLPCLNNSQLQICKSRRTSNPANGLYRSLSRIEQQSPDTTRAAGSRRAQHAAPKTGNSLLLSINQHRLNKLMTSKNQNLNVYMK